MRILLDTNVLLRISIYLLTINTRDFNRFTEINVFNPRALIIPV